MSGKKTDWDFRFIMGVMTLAALFGAWLFTKGYPAEWQAIKDAVTGALHVVGSAFSGTAMKLVVLASALIVLASVIGRRNRTRS